MNTLCLVTTLTIADSARHARHTPLSDRPSCLGLSFLSVASSLSLSALSREALVAIVISKNRRKGRYARLKPFYYRKDQQEKAGGVRRLGGRGPKKRWTILTPPLFRSGTLAACRHPNSLHKHFSLLRPSGFKAARAADEPW